MLKCYAKDDHKSTNTLAESTYPVQWSGAGKTRLDEA